MPRAQKYAGKLVYNERWGNRKQHIVANYVRYNRNLGIYSDTFDIMIKMLAKRIRNKQQNIIQIVGDTGSGKSTLAIEMCYALAKELNVTFDFDRDYIYVGADMWKKMLDDDCCPISLMDEASITLESMNSRSRDNRDIVQLFNTMRDRGLTTILVSPEYTQVDKSVRRVHTNFLIECSSPDHPFLRGYDRGLFELKDKRKSWNSDKDPYWNVLSTGIFGALDPKIEAIYLPIKKSRQNLIIEDGYRRHVGEVDA